MRAFRSFAFPALSVLALASVSACGSAPPPPPVEVAPPPEPPKPEPKVMAVSSELGSIDEDATEGVFRRLELALQGCHRLGMRRLRYLGGDIQFFLRIAQDGAVRYAFLQESTLGDRETERCMLDLVARADWPKPRGGEAEVRKKLGFDPPSDVKRPVDWPADKITSALHKNGNDARHCKAGIEGTFFVTMYVVPKGKQGRVQAAGVSPPTQDADEKAECIVKALKAMPVPTPGKSVAKVSFIL